MNSIQSIRARLGVTQAAMAKGLGVSQGNVSNYERGQAMPSPVARRLISYAESLGHALSFDDVYADECAGPPSALPDPADTSHAHAPAPP